MSSADDHPLNGAFLALRLDRLADLIAEQGEQLLRDAGLEMPSRTVSLFLLLGEHGPLSAADIARMLDQPHQLVTQRADILLNLALIERRSDAADGRRKILTLSAAGDDQFARLRIRLGEAADAFAQLYREIECDLAAMVTKAATALRQTPLPQRINALHPPTPHHGDQQAIREND